MSPQDYPLLMLGCLYFHPYLRGEGPGFRWYGQFGGDYSKAYRAIMGLKDQTDHAMLLEKFKGNEAFILNLSQGMPKTKPENFYLYYKEAEVFAFVLECLKQGRSYEKSGVLVTDEVIQAALSLGRACSSGPPESEVVDLTSLKEKKVKHLWKGWIPRGKISLLAGDPGEGKSYMSLDIAARVSRGDCFPDCEDRTQKGDVLIFSAEDDISDTILPRLNILDADLSRIHIFKGYKGSGSGQWDIRDIDTLRKIVEPYPELRLILADPIHSYMGDVKENSNVGIRNAVEPARLFGLEKDIALLFLLHRAKSSEYRSALMSVMGSIAWTAVSRSVMAIGRDKDDPVLRHLISLKCNLSRRPEPLSFRITNQGIEWEDENKRIDSEEILNPQPDKKRKRLPSALIQKSMVFLYDSLIDGPLPVKELYAMGEKAGFTSQQLDRAAGKISEDGRLGYRRGGDVSEGKSFSVWELLGA